MEALCIFLSRFAYPCRYGDMIKHFGMSVPQLCLINNYMIDHLYGNFNHLFQTLDQDWLNPAHLEQYAKAVSDRGAALPNCWGFVDGTVRPICRST